MTKSVSYYVWKSAIDRPFVVRATVGKVSNELVGSYSDLNEAKEVAKNYKNSRIVHAVSGKYLE